MKTLYPIQKTSNCLQYLLSYTSRRIFLLLGAIITISLQSFAADIPAADKGGIENFSLNVGSNGVQLNWFTPQDKSYSYFVVEKSYDGKTFKDAAIIFAEGQNSTKQGYLFSDKISDKKHSTVYYRLRIVDSTQNFKSSEVKAYRMAKIKYSSVTSPFVNNITDSLILSIPRKWQKQEVAYELFTADGEEVKTWSHANASKHERVEVKDLPQGKYMLKASCFNEVFLQRFTKSN